ncbi:MAG: type I-E CRISPR-associated endonuclease Cas1e [Armatimonadota bacterium]
MNTNDSPQDPQIQELPQVRDRLSFVYVERCLINRQDSAITVVDERGTVFVPAAVIGVLMLGPGTSISHRAMELLGDVGITVIWVGERGVRYYAHGKPLTHSSRLLIAQANLVSNTRTRLAVARKMYQMRFPNEDVSGMTMQQLRGHEGARIRAVYRRASRRTGVEWSGREYNSEDYAAGDRINMALSAAHACLYGIAHSVIVAIGCAPGLGFVHTGHERSFVYDIADLYKAELTIPIAFDIAATKETDTQEVGSATRRAVRDAVADGHILEKAVRDIRSLLLSADNEEEPFEVNTLNLWDEKCGFVRNAVSYGKEIDDTAMEVIGAGYGRILEDD